MDRSVTIYALVDESGVAQYVGRTRRLAQRRREHGKTWPDLTMIVLSRTTREHADQVEREMIAHYGLATPLRNRLGTPLDTERRSRRMKETWARRHAAQAECSAGLATIDVPIRLPAPWGAALRRVSAQQERTVNQQVIWMLRNHPVIAEALAARAATVPAAHAPEQGARL